jgi:hypothetical protein
MKQVALMLIVVYYESRKRVDVSDRNVYYESIKREPKIAGFLHFFFLNGDGAAPRKQTATS